MADIADASTLSPADSVPVAHEIEVPRLWNRIALGAVMLLSICMNFFLLGQNGYGNLYYASGVKSMGDSLHNFFFVAFDPGGFVTIDKPPFGFWLQTISTKIFGFTAFSIFLPQAICGVLSVLLLYYLVRRHFGALAGLIAALALAITPISVVTDRNNTIDGTLALALLLAAWAVIRAAESGKLRWLVLSGVFVGLGFNIKMSEAYLVVPALGLTYLLCAPRKIWTRIWHLLLVLAIMFVISLSWVFTVDQIPVGQRPYVGSTQNNSEVSLAFGYNGLNRLKIGGNGNGFGGNNRGGTSATGTPTGGTRSASTVQSVAEESAEAASAFTSGAIGPLHLFSASLGGQIAWLLPFALLGIVALIWQRQFNFQRDRQQLGLVIWGMWLLTMATFFSLDASFHQYYMTEMSPGLSAMVGIGLVIMWQDYRRAGWRGWLLPIALVLTAAGQIYILMSYPTWSAWLSPLIGVLTAISVIALILFRLRSSGDRMWRIAGGAVSVGLLALLVAPGIWSGYSVINNLESSFPTAGPTATGAGFAGAGGGGFANAGRNGAYTRGGFGAGGSGFGGGRSGATGNRGVANAGGAGLGGFGNESTQTDPALISYLESHQGSTEYLVATPSSMSADAIILATNRPVMAMGGFSGGDPILTNSSLQSMIKAGSVRFFLISSQTSTQAILDRLPTQLRQEARNFLGNGGGGSGGSGQQSGLSTWVKNHCNSVPSSAWQSAKSSSSGNTLYDCASSK